MTVGSVCLPTYWIGNHKLWWPRPYSFAAVHRSLTYQSAFKVYLKMFCMEMHLCLCVCVCKKQKVKATRGPQNGRTLSCMCVNVRLFCIAYVLQVDPY